MHPNPIFAPMPVIKLIGMCLFAIPMLCAPAAADNGVYGNDGYVYHTLWVVLVSDQRVAGGLAVRQFEIDDPTVVLPPTNPGMPLYLDSPGHPVNLDAGRLQVIVPGYRLRGTTGFAYDVVGAYLQVNTSDDNRPMLGVCEVYDVLSGDPGLPYRTVTR